MIKYLFVYSEIDQAGVNMANYLKKRIPFKASLSNILVYKEYALISTSKDIVYTDYIDRDLPFKPDTIIFLSRHSSVKEYPTLSVHVTGNPTDRAEYGGKPHSLAKSNPFLMKGILREMLRLRDKRGLSNYDVRLEVTHHGPTEVSAKVIFVEVGSTPRQWNDLSAINTVVDAVLNALKIDDKNYTPVVGFGGPHYAPLFTKIDLEEEYAIGHIFSKYVLSENVSWDVVLKAFKYTGDSRIAILDWKSIKGDVRQSLRRYLGERGIEIIKR